MATRRNLIFNVAGIVLPLIAAVVAVPLLISNFGLPRFGIFSILIAALSYIGMLDLGLSPAVTYKLAPLVGKDGEAEPILEIVRTALLAAMAIGIGVGIAAYLASGLAVGIMDESSAALVEETVWSARIFALCIPAIFAASLLSGVLAAHGRFDEINKVRVPVGILAYLGPAVGSLWTPNLALAAAIILALRLTAAIIHLYQCRRLLPALWEVLPVPSPAILKALFLFGGGLTVSNIVGPVMVYMDRFYLGAVRSAEDVARYVTPFEVATKLSLLPAAAMPVLFPLFVSNWATPHANSGRLSVVVTTWTAIGCAVPAALLAAIAPELMQAWLAGHPAQESALVLQILSGAVLANCVAQVFFMQVQSFGRTDIIAKIHLCELLVYVVMLVALTNRFGIVGVACAWAIRVSIDGGLFCWIACTRLTKGERASCWASYLSAVAYGAALASLGLVDSLTYRLLIVIVPLLLGWKFRAGFMLMWTGKLFDKDDQAGAETDGR